MVAIKDMKMPSCCYSCRFAKFPEYDYILGETPLKDPYCVVTLKGIDLTRFDRPDWCPLVEVESVKHAEWLEDGCLYKCSNCGMTNNYYSDSYCVCCGARMDKDETDN